MKVSHTPTGITVFGLCGPWRGLITAHYDRRMRLVAATHLNGRKTRELRLDGVLWRCVALQANRVRYKLNR